MDQKKAVGHPICVHSAISIARHEFEYCCIVISADLVWNVGMFLGLLNRKHGCYACLKEGDKTAKLTFGRIRVNDCKMHTSCHLPNISCPPAYNTVNQLNSDSSKDKKGLVPSAPTHPMLCLHQLLDIVNKHLYWLLCFTPHSSHWNREEKLSLAQRSVGRWLTHARPHTHTHTHTDTRTNA